MDNPFTIIPVEPGADRERFKKWAAHYGMKVIEPGSVGDIYCRVYYQDPLDLYWLGANYCGGVVPPDPRTVTMDFAKEGSQELKKTFAFPLNLKEGDAENFDNLRKTELKTLVYQPGAGENGTDCKACGRSGMDHYPPFYYCPKLPENNA